MKLHYLSKNNLNFIIIIFVYLYLFEIVLALSITFCMETVSPEIPYELPPIDLIDHTPEKWTAQKERLFAKQILMESKLKAVLDSTEKPIVEQKLPVADEKTTREQILTTVIVGIGFYLIYLYGGKILHIVITGEL